MTIKKKSEEPEITVDTPGPVAVEPPPGAISSPTASLPTSSTSATTPGAIAASSSKKPPTTDNTYADPTPVATLVEEPPLESNEAEPSPSLCAVVAPANLAEGYTFPAQVDGINFVVTVPPGGVTKGQIFHVPHPRTTMSSSAAPLVAAIPVESAFSPSIESAPQGQWRNGLFDCCAVVQDLMFWQGCCCTALLLGQVMTRFRLGFLGIPTATQNHANTFYILGGIWFAYFILSMVVSFNDAMSSMMTLGWTIFFTIVLYNTRSYMRKKYQIPADRDCCACYCAGEPPNRQCCGVPDHICEDVCCSLWCPCCVTIQMARHTHPVPPNQYYCCTPHGLSPNLPV